MSGIMIDAEIKMEVTPKSIARALHDPDLFAAVFTEFARMAGSGGFRDTPDVKIDLKAIGRAMAKEIGGMRKEPFIAILDYMRYYEREGTAVDSE